MSTPIIICDDSSLARKQMARALPAGWNIEITYATNGAEALVALKEGKGKIVFLDLNMPVMDGYQLLEALQSTNLDPLVIVVSGDIQPEARTRVLELGAREFLKKPVDKTMMAAILAKYNIQGDASVPAQKIEIEIGLREGCQEVANVAMGRAADLLARLLNVFVIMPIPNVNIIETSELRMALTHISNNENESVSAVCQGFIGKGLAGEALLMFSDSSFSDIASLMNYTGEIDETVELELLMDIASILIGACLKGIADQLDVNFSQGHPVVLGHHVHVGDLIKRNAGRWKETLAIEMSYSFENQNINCDLLLLFTEDSVAELTELVSYLSD